MLIVYDSMTGNNVDFVKRLGLRSERIQKELKVDEPFVLITYTTGFGQVPPSTLTFLKNHHHLLQAVAASGDKIWGGNFAISADTLSNMYGVPVLHKWEKRGTPGDVETLKERVQTLAYETYRIKQ